MERKLSRQLYQEQMLEFLLKTCDDMEVSESALSEDLEGWYEIFDLLREKYSRATKGIELEDFIFGLIDQMPKFDMDKSTNEWLGYVEEYGEVFAETVVGFLSGLEAVLADYGMCGD